MGIEASPAAISASATAQAAPSTTSSSKVSSSDKSFKDEMSKVSKSETKNETKSEDKDTKNLKSEKKSDTDNKSSSVNEDKNTMHLTENRDKNVSQDTMLNGQFSINDANFMLSNDIAQMIENVEATGEVNIKNWSFGFGENDAKSSLKMNESDADFFINLTQNDNINLQTVTAQAQTMLNNGAQISDVKQNVRISQALLNALSEARENNQPLRIDFDQNISVILRVGRDGAISAHFIPGDKAVEQYLRNNLETLKSTLDEQELPYSELSYSNASKEQNQRRREEKRQGE